MRVSMRRWLLAVVCTLVAFRAIAAEPPATQDAPRVTIDDVAGAPPAKLSDAEHAALKRLIAATPESDAQRAALVFRLAEHCRAAWRESRSAGQRWARVCGARSRPSAPGGTRRPSSTR